MKTKNKAKILVALMTLSLSSTTLPTIYAKGTSNNYEQSQEKIYTSSEYYFIRYNGNIYLATKVTENDEYNIIDKYYDAKTHRFIGQTLTPFADYAGIFIPSKRISEKINKTTGKRSYSTSYASIKANADCYRLNLLDEKYFGGKYGIGYNLPTSAIIPLNEIYSSSTFTNQDLNYFTSNNSKLKQELENNTIYTKIFIRTEFVDFHTIGFTDRITGHWQSTEEFICSQKNGSKDFLIGFRCSYFPDDNGYNYVYDLPSGSITYIGENSKYSEIVVKNYGAYKTLSDLKELVENKKQQATDRLSKKIKSEDIRVFCTEKWDRRRGDLKIGNLDSYYFVVNNKKVISDIERGIILISASNMSFYYQDTNGCTIAISRYPYEYDNPDKWEPVTITMDEFLKNEGYEDLIKKDGYTEKEILEIRNLIISEKNVLKKVK